MHGRLAGKTENYNGELMEVIELPRATCQLHLLFISLKWWPRKMDL